MRGWYQEDEHENTSPLLGRVPAQPHQQHPHGRAARHAFQTILTMTTFPNLAGVATSEMVEHIGTGKYAAAYVNWSRTMALLREHAPGWQPELVNAPDGYILHQAPVGAYLMIRFRHGEVTTPPVPQAIMDNRNAAIPLEKITARDITDTHRRGVCMAAAFTFGLAYELWAKLPLESGYSDAEPLHKAAPDVASIVRAIAGAATMDVLKTHFTAAWQMLDGPDRDKAKSAYDTRKQQLEEKEPA